jgi:histidyl-tRNA synthetase
MGKQKKSAKLKPRAPKGLRDTEAREVRALEAMLAGIKSVYELYGFEPLETPAFEYSDLLGKFLPDADRPNEGVFSLQDDDEQWLSLRYDLTAPLARYVAENYDRLPKPFRRYQTGPVWRNEKPGPGRYRQFTQFDADTVGTASYVADAEMCMMAADCLEQLGIGRGQYQIRVNDRRLLDGVQELAGISGDETDSQRLTVLRAIDKLDRLGIQGVEDLLGPGRKDESGAFTAGANLDADAIDKVLTFTQVAGGTRAEVMARLEDICGTSEIAKDGLDAVSEMSALFDAAGFGEDRIVIDPSIVRGLEYYTGPVFEAELTFATDGEDGERQRFGSVGGGGRYDGLIARFRPEPVPATGFSIGVSRLYAALDQLGALKAAVVRAPVVVLVMDRDNIADYQRMAQNLREAGIRAEIYMGTSGMRAQMKYADKRLSPVVVIQGEDERAKGEVTVKDLIEGARLADEITDNVEWREGERAQVSVPEDRLVETVRAILDRHAD